MVRNRLAKIVILLLLSLCLFSCRDYGCVAPDEFDDLYSIVKSNPIEDGIYGTYNDLSGGQRADWHNTNFRSNGQNFIIAITGNWVPWNAEDMVQSDLSLIPECRYCAIKEWDDGGVMKKSPNCLCFTPKQGRPLKVPASKDTLADCVYKDYNDSSKCILSPTDMTRPTPELGRDGRILKEMKPGVTGADCFGADYNNNLKCQPVDCSIPTNQNDPAKCTCTQQFGAATDYGVYHFPLDTHNKDETSKIVDNQMTCRYSRGMGLYLGLFGASGSQTPNRAYHLFTEQESCNVIRNANGECRFADGSDATQHLFLSRDNKIFVKDDQNGNLGFEDSQPDSVTRHTKNEIVKLVIFDRYYADNFGSYRVKFIKGIGNTNDLGLLEYLVKLVEDMILGTPTSDGRAINRVGGFIEFMYNSIVRDSGFMLAIQMALIIYITFYGLNVLIGTVEVTKKEIMSRMLKIGLVVFFVDPKSWKMYNYFVVGLFRDGMDFVISTLVNLSDCNVDSRNTAQAIACNARSFDSDNLATITSAVSDDRVGIAGNSTRFSYIDGTIKKMFSEPVTKKIWGLFFATIFGIVYIPIIYLLIFGFIYVMLIAGTIYILNIIKISFAIALGAIFIPMSLFARTNQIFKNWLAFLGARSLETILLFLILYMFVTYIDRTFMTMLGYSACVEQWGISFITFPVMKAQVDHLSLVDWIVNFFRMAGLIFIMKLMVDRTSSISDALISIGGTASKNNSDNANAAGSFAAAAGMVSDTVFDGAAEVANRAKNVAYKGGGLAIKFAGKAADAAGVTDAINKISSKIPFRGPRARMRDDIIDAAVKRAKEANKNLEGKDKDAAIRRAVHEELQAKKHGYVKEGGAWAKKGDKEIDQYRYLNLNRDTIDERLNKVLLSHAMKDKLKEDMKQMQKGAASDMKFGKDLYEHQLKVATSWAQANSSVADPKAIEATFEKLYGTREMTRNRRMKYDDVAAKVAGNKDAENRYLQYRMEKYGPGEGDSRKQQAFVRAANYQVQDTNRSGVLPKLFASFNSSKESMGQRMERWDMWRNKDKFEVMAGAARLDAYRDYYAQQFNKRVDSVMSKYAAKMKDAPNPLVRKKLQQARNKEIDELHKRFESFKGGLKQSIIDSSRETYRDQAKRAQRAADVRNELAEVKKAEAYQKQQLAGKSSAAKEQHLKQFGGTTAFVNGLALVKNASGVRMKKSRFELEVELAELEETQVRNVANNNANQAAAKFARPPAVPNVVFGAPAAAKTNQPTMPGLDNLELVEEAYEELEEKVKKIKAAYRSNFANNKANAIQELNALQQSDLVAGEMEYKYNPDYTADPSIQVKPQNKVEAALETVEMMMLQEKAKKIIEDVLLDINTMAQQQQQAAQQQQQAVVNAAAAPPQGQQPPMAAAPQPQQQGAVAPQPPMLQPQQQGVVVPQSPTPQPQQQGGVLQQGLQAGDASTHPQVASAIPQVLAPGQQQRDPQVTPQASAVPPKQQNVPQPLDLVAKSKVEHLEVLPRPEVAAKAPSENPVAPEKPVVITAATVNVAKAEDGKMLSPDQSKTVAGAANMPVQVEVASSVKSTSTALPNVADVKDKTVVTTVDGKSPVAASAAASVPPVQNTTTIPPAANKLPAQKPAETKPADKKDPPKAEAEPSEAKKSKDRAVRTDYTAVKGKEDKDKKDQEAKKSLVENLNRAAAVNTAEVDVVAALELARKQKIAEAERQKLQINAAVSDVVDQFNARRISEASMNQQIARLRLEMSALGDNIDTTILARLEIKQEEVKQAVRVEVQQSEKLEAQQLAKPVEELSKSSAEPSKSSVVDDGVTPRLPRSGVVDDITTTRQDGARSEASVAVAVSHQLREYGDNLAEVGRGVAVKMGRAEEIAIEVSSNYERAVVQPPAIMLLSRDEQSSAMQPLTPRQVAELEAYNARVDKELKESEKAIAKLEELQRAVYDTVFVAKRDTENASLRVVLNIAEVVTDGPVTLPLRSESAQQQQTVAETRQTTSTAAPNQAFSTWEQNASSPPITRAPTVDAVQAVAEPRHAAVSVSTTTTPPIVTVVEQQQFAPSFATSTVVHPSQSSQSNVIDDRRVIATSAVAPATVEAVPHFTATPPVVSTGTMPSMGSATLPADSTQKQSLIPGKLVVEFGTSIGEVLPTGIKLSSITPQGGSILPYTDIESQVKPAKDLEKIAQIGMRKNQAEAQLKIVQLKYRMLEDAVQKIEDKMKMKELLKTGDDRRATITEIEMHDKLVSQLKACGGELKDINMEIARVGRDEMKFKS